MPAAKRAAHEDDKPAEKQAAKPSTGGKVWPTVSLSYRGEPVPMDADLRDVLPKEIVEACLERGEASASRPDPGE